MYELVLVDFKNMYTIITAPSILYITIFILTPKWSSAICKYEFELAAETRIRDEKVNASQELYCSCGSNSCAFQVTYEHTSSWSHTVEGEVGANFFSFLSASISRSNEWGESATASSSVTCTANPGYKVWIAVVPKMVRKIGWGRKKCFGVTTEEAWVDFKAPLKIGGGKLNSEVWCEVVQFSKCVENANGTCHGINQYADTHDQYCRDNCGIGYCPPDRCAC